MTGKRTYKQIRVSIPVDSYNKLKQESKEYRQELQNYCGMLLSGLKIVKSEQ